jgi:hypothetical protein
VNRNDWIRLNLAKLIKNTKEEIISNFEEKYVHGFLTDEEFKEIVGFSPSGGMKELKEKLLKDKKEGEKNFRKYADMLAKEFDGTEKKPYLDKYIEGVIKKVEKERKRNVS